MKRAHGFLVVSLATVLLLSACKQGVGDRCQVNSDCQDGLFCNFGNNSNLTGGTCQRNGSGNSVDAAVTDASMDATSIDATGVDLDAADLSEADRPMSDAGALLDSAVADSAPADSSTSD